MQHANQCRQAQEPRISLNEHPLDLVELRTTGAAALFGSVIESLGHASENLKLPIGHGLEGDLKGQLRRRTVDLGELRAEQPEVVREYDGLVVYFGARLVAFGVELDVWKEIGNSNISQRTEDIRRATGSGSLLTGRTAASEMSARVRFCTT